MTICIDTMEIICTINKLLTIKRLRRKCNAVLSISYKLTEPCHIVVEVLVVVVLELVVVLVVVELDVVVLDVLVLDVDVLVYL